MKTVLLVLLALPLPACGHSSTASTLTATSAVSVATQTLYQELEAIPQADKQATLAAIRQLPVDQFYKILLANTPNREVVVDGTSYGNALASLQASASFYSEVAAHYPNVGAFWDDIGAPSALGASEFAQSMRAALGEPSLGLTGSDCAAGDSSCQVVAYSDSNACTDFWSRLAHAGVTQDLLIGAFSRLEATSGGTSKVTSSAFWPVGSSQGIVATRMPIAGSDSRMDVWSVSGLAVGQLATMRNNHDVNQCMAGPHKKRYGQ